MGRIGKLGNIGRLGNLGGIVSPKDRRWKFNR
jgi:hypothetical protein